MLSGFNSKRLFAVVLTLALLGCGCSGSKDKKADDKKKKQAKKTAEVKLPEPPPASALKVEEKNDDGSFRVAGLIATRGKHLGNSVRVKGRVSYVAPECDPREAAKKGKECPRPYLTITDDKESEEELMVVGFERDFLDRVELEEGETYDFMGTYKKLAQGFVATESGLLLLDEVNGEKVVEKGGG